MAVGNLGIPTGVEEQFFAKAEVTFDTWIQPVATDAITIKKSTFTCAKERVNRADKRASRSITERITRKTSVEWSMSEYWNPSGVAGTASDDHILIEALFGASSASASDVHYYLAKDIEKSFILRRLSGGVAETVTGAIVNQGIFRVKGEEEAEIEFSGMAADFFHTTRCVLAASAASGQADIEITDAGDFLSVNSVIQINSLYNTTGYVVQGIVGDVVTLTDNLEADMASAVVVKPWAPTGTVAGSPLGAITGTLTFDAENVYTNEFEITINNNTQMLMTSFGTSKAEGYYSTTFRNVDLKGVAFARDGYGKYRGKTRDFDSIAVVLVAGSGASGKKCTFTFPECEFNVVPFEFPEEEQITMTFEGLAMDTSAAEGECTLNIV
jgi:hypothetical protein